MTDVYAMMFESSLKLYSDDVGLIKGYRVSYNFQFPVTEVSIFYPY